MMQFYDGAEPSQLDREEFAELQRCMLHWLGTKSAGVDADPRVDMWARWLSARFLNGVLKEAE